MLTIPVTDKTFTKGFKGGSGSLDLSFTGSTGAATAIDPDAPFPDEAKALAAATVAGSSPELKFGSDSVACTASFGGGANFGVTLVRAGDGTTLPPGVTPPAAGRLGVLLSLGANAQAVAKASVTGPAGFSFGVSAKAGANAAFDRYLEFGQAVAARSILEAILSDIRLPQSRGTAADLPVAGELVQFSYAGFLELAAALNWGYSLTASEGFKVNDIQAKLDYALRAKAAITLGYRLAGDYTVALTRGHADGWGRLTVRKRRNARFQAAAGFDFTAKANVTGFPETPNEFLAAFLGTDAKTVLDVLDSSVEVTDLDALQKKVGKLLSGVVVDLAGKWTNGVLESQKLATVLKNIQTAVERYESIDDTIVQTVTEIYEKTLGPHKEALVKALRIVDALSGREDLRTVGDSDAWNLIQQIVGGDVHALISGDSLAPFAKLQAVAGTVLRMLTEPDFAPLRDVVDAIKSRLKLDQLFGQLQKVKTAQDIRDLRDTTLQGLVERVVGRTFAEIKDSELGDVAADVQKTVTAIQQFKNTFAAKAQKALHQSFQLQVNFLYTRATANDALIDVEIDLNAPGGQALFADAAAGRIGPVFAAGRLGRGIVVNKALLTHAVTRSTQLQFNAFGWEFKRLVEVVTKSDVSLQAHAGGLVQVFTTSAALKQMTESGGKHKERMQANLLLRMAGQTFGSSNDLRNRDYLIQTLESMSVDYDLVTSDDMTDVKELTEYLELGKQLGLVPDGLTAELETQFGKRLGKVSATYTVRFDHKAVQDAFVALTADQIDPTVRRVARQMVAAAMVRRGSADLSGVGLAYAHGKEAFELHRAATLVKTPVQVSLPGWVTGGQGSTVVLRMPFLQQLDMLFFVEDELVKRFTRLDTVIDTARKTKSAVSLAQLEDAATKVLDQGATIDKFAPNAFFAVFDALVRVGGLGKSHRESALLLEITPPGGETVTRFFMDNALVPSTAEAP
jgi:hypothetical protein